MYKVILPLLVALVATNPCLAAEGPDRSSPIDGTQWISSGIRISIEPPYFERVTSTLGFYQGTVYVCLEGDDCTPSEDYAYSDLPLISIAFMLSFSLLPVEYRVELLIMQPAGGFGQLRAITWWREADCVPSLPRNCIGGYLTWGTMIKTSENWMPPGVE
jgi:hypothetical protein